MEAKETTTDDTTTTVGANGGEMRMRVVECRKKEFNQRQLDINDKSKNAPNWGAQENDIFDYPSTILWWTLTLEVALAHTHTHTGRVQKDGDLSGET